MYNVRAADGRVYGPADIETLKGWVAEGRMNHNTTVIDTSTNREFPARELPGLFDQRQQPGGAWAQPPGQSPYPRTGPAGYAGVPSGYADQELRTGWTYFWVGIVGIFCCAVLSWIMFPLAIRQAAKAMSLGNPTGATLRTLSIVFLIVSVALAVIGVIVRVAMFQALGGF